IIKEGFLRQNALDPIERYTILEKQFMMLKTIIDFYDKATNLMTKFHITLDEIIDLPIIEEIKRMKYIPNEKYKDIKKISDKMEEEFKNLL
ncbi:MAG: ATP synthase beta subunit C-terminal domain-containing protein, partial [Candidatus Helarchaeota archaeon]